MNRSKRSRRTVTLLALALVLPACTPPAPGVSGSGTVEMDEVDVASLTGGRIVVLAVAEGDTVAVGDTLAILDRGEVVADVRAQEALAGRAIAQWRDVEAGPRPDEIAAARADLKAATAQAELATSDARRFDELHRSGSISDAERDRAIAQRDAAEARRDAAARALALLEAGTRRLQVVAAAEAARAAQAQRSAAVDRARELVLTAPISGVVLTRNLLAGEIALAGQAVVTLGQPDRLWMRVYIAAPKIGAVRLGAPAQVTTLALKGRTFDARVVEIARQAEFTPRAALTEEEQANLVFGVKLALAPTGGTLKAGLPADARIVAAP